MNIFVLHLNPIIAAQMHCDRHVVKMIIESAQLLYCCILVHGVMYHDPDIIETAPLTSSGTHGYRVTHRNHPCAIWVAKSVANYEWLITMAKELCRQYTIRYGKTHATEQHIDWLSYLCPNIPDVPLTPFSIVMPDVCKCLSIDQDIDKSLNQYDPVKSYRNYYIMEKKWAKWEKTEVPYWWT